MTPEQPSVEDQALLVAYVDGDLSLVDAAEFEQRLATEPALAAALHSFVAADDLGQRLPYPGRLRSPRRSRFVPGGILVAAAAALLILLFRPGASAVSIELVGVEQNVSRGGSDSAVDFRVELECARECYLLILTAVETDSEVVVRQLHPPKSGPLVPRNPDWPRDPLPVGDGIVLPPASSFPWTLSDAGFVLMCTREDGPFEPEDESRVRSLLRNAVTKAGDADRGPEAEIAAAVRIELGSDWQVECLGVRMP